MQDFIEGPLGLAHTLSAVLALLLGVVVLRG